MQQTRLTPHPRLYVGEREFARLREPLRLPFLRAAAEQTRQMAEEFVRSAEVEYDATTHNAHLIRARRMQTRVVTLLTEWKRSGDSRFRAAAMRHLDAMSRWECWSWITWRKGNVDPSAIYDLSYGENSTTLAIAYDWLHGSFSAEEKQLLVGMARRWSVASLQEHGHKGKAWWFGQAQSNWNAVCAGGGGMLMLAMLEELPEAAAILGRMEDSVAPYMKQLDRTHGAWPEGIHYWNYGMRYAFMYLLSHERATGQRHPLLRSPNVRRTLEFPLDFCPNGVPCSFGDENHWQPLPFHYAAAQRLGCEAVIAGMDDLLLKAALDCRDESWPSSAELLLLHPRRAAAAAGSRRHVVRVYGGLDWSVMADRQPRPRACLTIRGGTTEVEHGHRDLLSFHCVVGDEALISNVGVSEYLDTTFSPRRDELFETAPPSKNTIMINGVGIARPATVRTRAVNGPGFRGIRLEATEAMGGMRDGAAASFCARLFLMLPDGAFVVVDRTVLAHFGRVESRMHTYADAAVGRTGARLRGKRQRMRIAFASDVPAALWTAVNAPTTPGKGATMLRWCARNLQLEVTLAALLSPGAAPAALALTSKGQGIELHIRRAGRTRTIRLTRTLLAQGGGRR